MRVSPKIAGFLMVLLTGAAETAHADCQPTNLFLESVKAGTTPKPENLDISCLNDKDEELAAAVASFLEKRGKDSDSVTVIDLVQNAYQNDSARFVAFAQELQKQVGADLRFEVGDKNKLLDPLLNTLRSRSAQDFEKRFGELEGRVKELENSAVRQPGQDITKKVDNLLGRLLVLAFFTLITFAGVAYVFLSRILSPGAGQPDNSPENSVSIPPTGAGPLGADKLTAVASPTSSPVESVVAPGKPGPDELKELKESVQKLKEDVGGVAVLAGRCDGRLTEIEGRVQQAKPTLSSTSTSDLDLVYKQIGNMKSEINELQRLRVSLADKPNSTSTPSSLLIDLEYDVLCEAWRKLGDNKEFKALRTASWLKTWEEISNSLLVELPPVVPEEIKPTFDMVMGPARDFHNMVTKISLARRVVKKEKELPALTSESQELIRLRELASLLTMIQNSNAVADRLNFNLEQWVCDQFVSFADLFLQRYQQAQLDGGQSVQAKLEPGLQIVRKVLKIADLEPVDLTPGQTPFDSNRHIGRSTASNSSFANNVIVGVVRNGFIRGGREVIRQPEVIVNRLS